MDDFDRTQVVDLTALAAQLRREGLRADVCRTGGSVWTLEVRGAGGEGPVYVGPGFASPSGTRHYAWACEASVGDDGDEHDQAVSGTRPQQSAHALTLALLASNSAHALRQIR